MNKNEFLQALRGELTNSVSGEVIEEQLRFYSDYINTEIAKGRAEESFKKRKYYPYFLRAILRYSDGKSPVLFLKFAANLPALEYPTAEATCSIARSVETRSISA